MSQQARRFRPQLEVIETRLVPAAFTPISDDAVAVAPDDGGIPRVKIVDPVTGEDVGEIEAYADAFRGGVRTALGDVTGDGVRDLVIAPGPGGGPRVRIVDGKTGGTLADFFVYDAAFTGGLYVALGDINADGHADIITGTGPGGGPRVRVLDGATLGATVLRDFFAYDGTFRGGVLVAAGDLDGDGRAEVITGTGPGGGPRVMAFSGADNHLASNFFAYEAGFRGGVLVAAGDVDGNGRDDIITGTGPGGGPVARAFRPDDGARLLDILADDSAFRGGVGVDARDVDGDGRDDVITHTRHGNAESLFVFDGRNGGRIRSLSRTVDDNPSANDIAEGGSGGGSGSGSGGGSGSGSGGSGNTAVASQVEGTVTAVNAGAGTVTIRPASGAAVTVRTTGSTRIERNDHHATLAEFQVGDFGEAKLGADGFALKVEANG